MNEYLEQIAKMLVDSADVPTDASDVADDVCIVQTVKNALYCLSEARHKATELHCQLVADTDEIERLNAAAARWHAGANELQDKLLAAQQEIGSLTERLSAATRNARRWESEAVSNQARYEGMEAALRTVLELAGVGK